MLLEVNRRKALYLLGASAAASVLPVSALSAQTTTTLRKSNLSKSDDAFLDEMERRACLYFVEQSSPVNGQVLDRAAFYGNNGKRDPRNDTSIAATGFGLTALCIGDARGYITHAQARDQVLRTLRYHATSLPHEHGFFYHFNDIDTGKPASWSEVSSIDTALLLCGVLTARAHFVGDKEIADFATAIYNRVDWPWMLRENIFSMGWRPKTGFLSSGWNHYCEMMMIPLLALGSPTHPVDASVWTAFSRPRMQYKKFIYISGSDPLFVHQYSHAYFDFRNKQDEFANYFDNSVLATQAHEQFCLDLGKPYSKDYWGISASDSRRGYQVWGGPPKIGILDGSVVPNAAAGSLPFLPSPCLRVLRALQKTYGDKVWGSYGFTDAFNPALNWFNADVVGIDLGIGMLMAENLRSGFVWSTFAKNPEAAIGMNKAGFLPMGRR